MINRLKKIGTKKIERRGHGPGDVDCEKANEKKMNKQNKNDEDFLGLNCCSNSLSKPKMMIMSTTTNASVYQNESSLCLVSAT